MSPIVGVTNQQAEFPEIGQLRKGAPKPENGIGRDLKHFRFTSTIPEVEEAFEEAYGKEPTLISVLLPHPYTDGEYGNWDAWREEYGAGSLKHRCDGKFVVRIQGKDGTFTDPEPGTMRCPGGCKMTGRLKVIIPDLRRLALVMVLTTSINDIINLDKQLRALERLHGKLTGIPMLLRRSPDKISTPGSGGKRVRRESWLLSIEAAPTYVDMQLAAQEAAAIPQLASGPAPAAPPGDNGDTVTVDAQTGEILESDWVWDEETFAAGEDEPEAEPAETAPLPDFLTVQVPAGDYKGRTMGWLLENDIDYLGTVADEAKDQELRTSAAATLEWMKEVQPRLPL